MSNLTRDPKGYYVALGVPEDADAAAIKAAYRGKAKRLHPDFNPSPIAAKQFHRLHEAYETLSDPSTRAAYDRPWRTEGKPKDKPHEERTASAETSSAPPPPPPPKRPKEQAHTHTTSTKFSARPSAPAIDQPAVCKCGKITAQPRYLIFDLVWGRFTRVQRRGISGVFCRSCADRTAIKASLLTWIAGWWAPSGPRETIRALLNNIRGGRKPADRNARLLMRQARAFRARGEMELARNAAEQALTFATTPHLRRDVDTLLLSLSAHPARALKDRWAKPGWAPMVQVLPLAIVVAVVSTTTTLSLPTPITVMVKDLMNRFDPAELPMQSGTTPTQTIVGRVYSVAAQNAALRTGPGSNYQLEAVLKNGTLVLATESDPSGSWLRIETADGSTGFVAATDLTPDVRIDALDSAGGFGKPEPTPVAPASATPE